MKLYRWRIATREDLENIEEKLFRDSLGGSLDTKAAYVCIDRSYGVVEVLEECPKFGWSEVIQAARVSRETGRGDDFASGVNWVLAKLLNN